ncbi:MAG: restriction endonuclease subunit S [Desulfobulbaceae bacterium]|nr:restriction endonuclease subunit S [Desulfobulbaceae bacterium]
MKKSYWTMKNVEDLFDVQLGKMLNEKAKQGDLVPYLANFNVRWGAFDLSRLNEMAFSEKEQKKYSLQIGDLLMCEGGEIGRCAVWEGEEKTIYFQKALHRLRPLSKDIKPEFVYYYMQHIASKGELPKLVGETSIAHLTREKLLCLRIPTPAPSEQIAIVGLLSTWDLAIEKTERLMAAKERRYLSISKKYLFGDADQSSNTTKKTKWFSVPDHWEIVKIGKIAKDVSTFNNSGENIPVLSCTKYDGLVDSLTYFDKQVFSLDTSTYKVVSRGQFAYATNHIEEGSIGYQDVYGKGLVSPMYTVFETNKSVDDSYLYKVLKSVVYLHIFRANTSSSVDRRGSLRWKEFAKLPIPLPPIEEQKHIAAILTAAREEIDLLKKQAEAYRRQKRGLMQKLLTGEWRVKTDKETV